MFFTNCFPLREAAAFFLDVLARSALDNDWAFLRGKQRVVAPPFFIVPQGPVILPAVLLRNKITKDFFINLWKKIEASGAGEPGIYLSNDKDWGTNPCCEIALRPFQFCNLCEVNVSDVTSQEDLNERAAAAAFIGTLQAGYTNFHYLRPVWQRTTEKDA